MRAALWVVLTASVSAVFALATPAHSQEPTINCDRPRNAEEIAFCQQVLNAGQANGARPSNIALNNQGETYEHDKIWGDRITHGACSRLRDRRTDSPADIAECNRDYAMEPMCMSYKGFASAWYDMANDPNPALSSLRFSMQTVNNLGSKRAPSDPPYYHSPRFHDVLRRLVKVTFSQARTKWKTRDQFADYAYKICMEGHPFGVADAAPAVQSTTIVSTKPPPTASERTAAPTSQPLVLGAAQSVRSGQDNLVWPASDDEGLVSDLLRVGFKLPELILITTKPEAWPLQECAAAIFKQHPTMTWDPKGLSDEVDQDLLEQKVSPITGLCVAPLQSWGVACRKHYQSNICAMLTVYLVSVQNHCVRSYGHACTANDTFKALRDAGKPPGR